MSLPSVWTKQHYNGRLSTNKRPAEREPRADWTTISGHDVYPALAFSDFAGNPLYQLTFENSRVPQLSGIVYFSLFPGTKEQRCEYMYIYKLNSCGVFNKF